MLKSIFQKIKFKNIRFFNVFLMVVFCLTVLSTKAFAEEHKPQIWVSDPWLYVIVKFIGGVYCDVHPVSFWDENGNIVRVSNPPRGSYVFVLYRGQEKSKKLGISLKRSRIVPIYENKPSGLDNNCYFLDPSVLPFFALGAMRSISAIDTEHYSYYQRRLAEFQTRLDSVVRVGRQLLWNVEICDFTDYLGGWFKAVSGKSRQSFGHNKKISEITSEELSKRILSIKARKGVIVYNSSLPKDILSVLEKAPFKVKFGYPSENQDFFVYLYELNLSVWNAYRLATS